MKNGIISILLLNLLFTAEAQVGVGIGTNTPDTSAMLEVASTTKGMLVPRMSTTQRTAIQYPANGLLVYDTNFNGFWFYTTAGWLALNNTKNAWSFSGNALAGTELLGSTNSLPLKFITNNTERFRLSENGNVLVGTTSPNYTTSLMEVVGTSNYPNAINGISAFNGSGVYGEINSNNPTSRAAIQGDYRGTSGAASGNGVLGSYSGTSTSGGVGIYGYNAAASGNQRVGILGSYNGSAYGLGVVGIGFGGGIMAGNNDVAVVGWRQNNANYSGYFNGNHVIANGTKSASVGTSWGNQLLYVTETPEVWFEDIGRGQLVNGQCSIQLDSIFLQVCFIDSLHPIHVFIQEEGECEDLYVITDNTGFTVHEKRGGHSNVPFSYRIMAKRVHFQDHRYGNDAVWGAGDTRSYMQYAPPTPIDYNKNVNLQAEQKRNFKEPPLPANFIRYSEIQAQLKSAQRTKQ